jgi:microcystin-dependent protein
MALVTTGYTFVNNETVTPAKLNSLAGSATVTQIVDADVSATAGIVDTKLATIATAGKVANTATTATSANTASAIVARDASGNFSAGTITATTVSAGAFAGTGATLLVPTGAVMPFAMNSAPTGWLAANGTEYAKTGTYAALFAAIGVTYGETNGAGGAGTTHFRVPDLRGYFVRGVGTNADGTASGTFGAKQADSIIDHTHNYTRNTVANVVSVGGPTTFFYAPGAATSLGVNSPNNGGVETRPNNIAMLYCIKF